MKGVGWNDNNRFGCDSITAFDDLGLLHWIAIRPEGDDFLLRATSTIVAIIVDRPTINWHLAKDGVSFNDGRESEIGRTFQAYQDISGIHSIMLMRALKTEGTHLIHSSENFDYLGFSTSLADVFGSWESRVIRYRERGHAENFIKDLKYGLDLVHYP